MTRTDRRAAALRTAAVLAIAVAAGPASACGQDCGNVDCGAGLTITWDEDDVPTGSIFRVCTDGQCKDDVPNDSGLPGQKSISGPSGSGTANIRLAVLDENGLRMAEYTGTAKFSGGCCSHAELAANSAGHLVQTEP